jgi:hypothetical protein
MQRLSLPTREQDRWQGELLDNTRPMRLVTASGGFVAAAGAFLVIEPPGERKLSMRRVLDEGMGVTAIAVEPWPPHRYAIATKAGVNLYPADPARGPLMELTPKDPDKFITHLAFAKIENVSFLFFRMRFGTLNRVRLEEGVTQTELVHFENAAAIASDADGTLAVLDATEGAVYINSPTGRKGWDVRQGHFVHDPETKDDDPDDQFQLAVCNGAVAYTTWGECKSAHVSWGPEQDLDLVSITCSGPLTFADKDTLLLSDSVEEICKVACVPREGDKYLVADLSAVRGIDGPVITSIAYDSFRRHLWCMAGEFGMYRATPPSKETAKVIVYS